MDSHSRGKKKQGLHEPAASQSPSCPWDDMPRHTPMYYPEFQSSVAGWKDYGEARKQLQEHRLKQHMQQHSDKVAQDRGWCLAKVAEQVGVSPFDGGVAESGALAGPKSKPSSPPGLRLVGRRRSDDEHRERGASAVHFWLRDEPAPWENYEPKQQFSDQALLTRDRQTQRRELQQRREWLNIEPSRPKKDGASSDKPINKDSVLDACRDSGPEVKMPLLVPYLVDGDGGGDTGGFWSPSDQPETAGSRDDSKTASESTSHSKYENQPVQMMDQRQKMMQEQARRQILMLQEQQRRMMQDLRQQPMHLPSQHQRERLERACSTHNGSTDGVSGSVRCRTESVTGSKPAGLSLTAAQAVDEHASRDLGAVQDYQLQLRLLEQQNKKRLLATRARRESNSCKVADGGAVFAIQRRLDEFRDYPWRMQLELDQNKLLTRQLEPPGPTVKPRESDGHSDRNPITASPPLGHATDDLLAHVKSGSTTTIRHDMREAHASPERDATPTSVAAHPSTPQPRDEAVPAREEFQVTEDSKGEGTEMEEQFDFCEDSSRDMSEDTSEDETETSAVHLRLESRPSEAAAPTTGEVTVPSAKIVTVAPSEVVAVPDAKASRLDRLVLPDRTKQIARDLVLGRLFKVTGAGAPTRGPLVIHFFGPTGTGKTKTARALADLADLPLITIRPGTTSMRPNEELNHLSAKSMQLVHKLAERSCIFLVDDADYWASPERPVLARRLADLLAKWPGVVLLVTSGEATTSMPPFVRKHVHVSLPFPRLERARRRLVWEKALADEGVVQDWDPDALAKHERNGHQITHAIHVARLLAGVAGEDISAKWLDVAVETCAANESA